MVVATTFERTDLSSIVVPTLAEDAIVTLVASALTEDAPTGILPTIEERDDDVVVVKAPTIPAKLIISQAPSMSKVGSEDQLPTVTQVPPSLDWASTPVEGPSSRQQGKAPTSSTWSGASTKSWTSSSSSRSINIQIPIGESALQNPALARYLIEAILLLPDKRIQKNQTLVEIFSSFYSTMIVIAHDVLALDKGFRTYADTGKKWSDQMVVVVAERDATLSVRADKKSTEWIIETLKSRIRRKRQVVSRLRKKHDNCLKELEEERKKLRSFEVKVVSIKVALDLAKEQTLEEFQGLKNFKEELLVANHLAYLIGCKDGRDAVGQAYLDLDLSHVALFSSNKAGIDEDDESAEADSIVDVPIGGTASAKNIPIDEAALIAEPIPTSDETILKPPPIEEEMASAMEIIDIVVVDDFDH
ncbi:hypothetical protein COCNU_14G011010 [Cocos nucifera]|uniref:Uncharacterized protein n=1 Tax=Cocos nucifera TaxID=13894 RepID=A0A8K0IW86_COCNU|nr:hypothetical protein COCNU_14G011010 [Cocos nucifera]